jgi:CheY-like chemotaxis protein
MTRGLIVEDDENKRAPLRQFFSEYFPTLELAEEVSLMPAVERALQDTFDFVILDMTLPFYAGDKGGLAGTHTFGGEEFLSQLDRAGVLVPVIVFSQFETFGEPPDAKTFEQLGDELGAAYPEIYRGAIYYHASKSDWIENLRTILAEIVPMGGSK